MVKYILERGKDFDKSRYLTQLMGLEGKVFDNFAQVDKVLGRVVSRNNVYRAHHIIYTAKELPVIIDSWPIYEEQKNSRIEHSNGRSIIRYEIAMLRVIAY